MIHKMLVVPADASQEVTVVEHDDTKLAELVFGDKYPERSELSFSGFRHASTQCAYDDLGLYREDAVRNRRAMELWARLNGLSVDEFVIPLVGTFVFLGLNPNDGETTDVPLHVIDLATAEPTSRVCPKAPAGETHYLVPRGGPHLEGRSMVCRYCHRTEQELRS